MKKLISIFALLILIHSISKTQTYFLKDKNGTIIISHKVSNFDTLLKIDANLLDVPGTPAQKLQALTNYPNKVVISKQDVITYNIWGTKATEATKYTYISSADGKSLKKSSCQELIRKRPAYEIVVIYLCMIVIGCILSYYKNNQKKAIAYISIALIGLWLSLGLGLSLGLWLMIGFGLLIGIGFGIVIGSLISMGIQIGIEFGILIGIGIGIGFGIVIGSLIGIGIEIVIQDIFFLIIISLLMYSLSYFITQYVTKKIQPAV
ncbi:MAG TPA: hypothetical protein PLW93_02260 [Candidatus Absconditabacterales bacterium]|nr:hypothetical protein [Candidatus Absconditabacterales bacterium]HNG97072.1 hypothetical protein [Candidatus Absconditabacterales bacterium]